MRFAARSIGARVLTTEMLNVHRRASLCAEFIKLCLGLRNRERLVRTAVPRRINQLFYMQVYSACRALYAQKVLVIIDKRAHNSRTF